MPYIPIYKRPPNKFISYHFKEFDDGHGHKGKEKIAIYVDKNKNQKEISVNIVWGSNETSNCNNQ